MGLLQGKWCYTNENSIPTTSISTATFYLTFIDSVVFAFFFVLKDWIDKDVGQVQVETHKLPGNKTLGIDFFESFKKNNLAMFSKEVNGFGKGKSYEFSYVKLHPDFLTPPSLSTAEAA